MPLTKDLVLTINGRTASLSETCFLYRGDRGIVLNITIQQYKYKFQRRTVENLISENTSIVHARALIHKPGVEPHEPPMLADDYGNLIKKRIQKKDPVTGEMEDVLNEFGEPIEVVQYDYSKLGGGCFQIPFVDVLNDTIKIEITQDWTDDLDERGVYQMQLQLYGIDPKFERITIPPVAFIEVGDPMCFREDPSEFDNIDVVGYAAADFALIREQGKKVQEEFDNGIYNAFGWDPGEVITAESLNNMDDAIKYSIEKLATVPTREELNAGLDTKADKDHNHICTYEGTSYNTLNETFTAVSNDIDSVEEDMIRYSDANKNAAISASKEYTNGEITEVNNKIKENADNIASNTSAINENAANIALNKGNIETNRKNIETNKRNIETNTSNIETNRDNIAENTADIAINKGNIETNRKNIETNKRNIETNISNIETNRDNIAENVANIALNKSNLEKAKNDLNGRIDGVISDLGDTNAKVAIIEGDLENTKDTLTTTINRVTTLETNLETAKKDLMAEIDAVDSKLDKSVEVINENINTAVSELTADITDAIVTANNFTKDYTKNMIQSTSFTHIELVEEYPAEEDKQEGYVYILIEEI